MDTRLKDPYKSVDVLFSSRRVRVSVFVRNGGEDILCLVADVSGCCLPAVRNRVRLCAFYLPHRYRC